MGNKYMKQCSISVVKKICTKTIMSYNKNFIKIAKTKRQCQELMRIWHNWNTNTLLLRVDHFEKQFASFIIS